MEKNTIKKKRVTLSTKKSLKTHRGAESYTDLN